jgi:hypothetical protein
MKMFSRKFVNWALNNGYEKEKFGGNTKCLIKYLYKKEFEYRKIIVFLKYNCFYVEIWGEWTGSADLQTNIVTINADDTDFLIDSCKFVERFFYDNHK